jgi:hypothetical protein
MAPAQILVERGDLTSREFLFFDALSDLQVELSRYANKCELAILDRVFELFEKHVGHPYKFTAAPAAESP